MRSVDERVGELLERVREGAITDPTRKPADQNEEKVEDFIRTLEGHPARTRLKILRQEIPWHARRTTRMNYVFEVPGQRPDKLVLVAHYDTWGGPGADDNTTGEEILKQYLQRDLETSEPPVYTHTYLLAGSEECGLIGFLSQVLVTGLFWAASLAVSTGNAVAAVVALALAPMLKYRFGVAGSRHFVRTLPRDELEKIRAVISVDSVGEGKLYFPTTTLGADMLRAVFPYAGHDDLDDTLKEIAHCRGIRYNTNLAGGTTDHLSFLEVNRSLPRTLWETLRWLGSKLSGRPYTPPFTIAASAIIAMCPGKASPFLVGGKLHTPKDTFDRVFAEPLRETLFVLDDFFERYESNSRPRKPRDVGECHYARLYRLSDGRAVCALKDAVEPNRRNINIVCTGSYDENAGTFDVAETLDWGNEISLDREVAEFAARHGLGFHKRKVPRLVVREGSTQNAFERQSRTILCWLSWLAGQFEDLLGRFSFLAMFAAAILTGYLLNWLVVMLPIQRGLTAFLGSWQPEILTTVSVALQLFILVRLFTRSFPTWIDNAYKHLNRADNLGSLKAGCK